MKLKKADIQKLQDYFIKQKDVLAVYLYGSFAKGTPHKSSDLDFGILFNKPVNLYHRLGKIYSDLGNLKLPAEPEARDINLDRSPVYLFNVIKGQLIFSRDDTKRVNFEVQALKQYYDTQKLRDIKYYYMNKRLQEGTYGYR